MAIDLDQRRKERHERVRELRARVKRVRRNQKRRNRSRFWGTFRTVLFVAVLLVGVVVLPGLLANDDAPDRTTRRSRAIEEIEDMLGSDEFYWFTINAAPVDDIHRMTNDEIVRFGLLTAPIG